MDPKLEKVHEDKRGPIYILTGMLDGQREVSYLGMVKDSARGGCLHSNDEYFVVLGGKIKYLHGATHPMQEEIVNRGQSRMIPAGEIHAFIALEDSVVSEWGITSEEKRLDRRDSKLREIIDDMNKSLS